MKLADAAQASPVNELLTEAHRLARQNMWSSAADVAGRAIDSKTFLTLIDEGEALEFFARCHFKAAFQSKSRDKFKELMDAAQKSSRKAQRIFDQASQPELVKRAECRSLFAEFWSAEDFALRRSIIQRCLSLSTEAATDFEVKHDLRHLVETRRDLLTYFRESLNLSSEWTILNQQFHQALHTCRKCASELEQLGDNESLIEALNVGVWLLSIEGQILLTPDEFRTHELEARNLNDKLSKLSNSLSMPLAACLAFESAGNIAFDFDGKYDTAMNLYEKAGRAAEGIGDSLLSGRVNWLNAQAANWLGSNTENIDARRTILQSSINSAMASIRFFEASRSTTDLAAAYASCSDCHVEHANQVETTAAGKEEHLIEAIRLATIGIGFEEETWAWSQAAHVLSKAMFFLSRIVRPDSKRQLLIEALPIRKRTVEVADRLFPSLWSPMVMRNYSALLETDLALGEQRAGDKIRRLEEAVSDMKTCLDLGSRWATSPGISHLLGTYSEWYGNILNEIFLLTRESATATRAVATLQQSIGYLEQSGHTSGIGPIRWRIARIQDALGDFESASATFKTASEEYRAAAEKIPGLAFLYNQVALYMDAWCHTEMARLSHDSGSFLKAAQEYSRSADTLQGSKTWDYLAGLFKARSILEKGEGLSREENHDDALQCFASAGLAFKEARQVLVARVRQSSELVEQQEISDWLRITEARDDYCRYRADLEEARALETRGERAASARKYEKASLGFRALRSIGNPQDPEELDALVCFCDAWGKMQDAEAKSSPELYSEAANSFLAVKKGHTKEQFQLLGLANSSICRALEAGTRFRQTREIQSYAEVKKWLESAADYYREAGFGKTETWTRATQRLFDALVYLFQAETDKDPGKKTSLYHMAESQLELAAKLYGEAGFPTKKLEALGRLKRVREEKQVLVAALTNLSRIPTLTGSSLVPVALSRGQPSGLERFEEAYVVGELSTPKNEVLTGTALTLEVDIANVGRTAATLLKVDGIVQDGLAYDEAKNSYRRENGSINLAGKRLDNLQTFKARVTLAAAQPGDYQLRPKVFFTDDRGNYRSYEFRSNTLKVLEPGTLSGPSMSTLAPLSTEVQLPDDFRFDTQRAKDVFQNLVNDFLKDYVSKRLSMDNAGWRSLMEIVREAKTPRSSFYGPQGKVGPVLAELERRGLVEVRVFPGERGRGGTVRKLRVAYDNRIVRDIVQKAVMERS